MMLLRGRGRCLRLLTCMGVLCLVANFLAKWFFLDNQLEARANNKSSVGHKGRGPGALHVGRKGLVSGPLPEGNITEAQAILNHMAETLEVQFELVSNLPNLESHRGRITLINHSPRSIPQKGWTIYFYYAHMLEETQMDLNGYAILSNLAIKLTHVNGNLFKLEPTGRFPIVKTGNRFPIGFHANNFVVSQTDIWPNWYVAMPGAQPAIIRSTQGESLSFVQPFDSPEKWKRSVTDRFDPVSPRDRFAVNDEIEDIGKPGILVIPSPAQMTVQEEVQLTLSQAWVILPDSASTHPANILAEKINLKLATSKPKSKYLWLQVTDLGIPPQPAKSNHEYYSIDVDPKEEVILVKGQTPVAILHAVQTLISLIGKDGRMPEVHINDAPRFIYRGLMVDVARNFHSKEAIMKILDLMSMYKMNKLHFHLTDDEGWRLEIPGLPELTQIGGRRGHDLNDSSCLLTALGSGPHPQGLGSGFYTVADYKQILKHAQDRYIEIIPEIDVPGHARAAVKAMEARYRRLNNGNLNSQAKEFLLSDPDDRSRYHTVQLFKDNIINICMNSTYRFLDHVISKMIEMHKDIQPLRTVHLGGDEVPARALKDSPICQRFKRSLGNRVRLNEYFIKRMTKIFAQHKINLQGWEDIFMFDDQPVPMDSYSEGRPELIGNAWMNRWEWSRGHRAHQLANAGYKVVLSPGTHLYLDHTQDVDPQERGAYWSARYVDARKVFGFLPDSFFDNIEDDLMGKPLTKTQACSSRMVNCLPLAHPENIIGMSGHIWGEVIRTEGHLFYMLLPRLLALAERAWHKADWEMEGDPRRRNRRRQEDYAKFANSLGHKELARLDGLGYQYYLPLPGVEQENGELRINSAYPGLPVVYSKDNGITWQELKTDAQISGHVLLATSSFSRMFRSRNVPFSIK